MTELTQTGRSAVLLCSPQIRSALRRMIEASLPQVAVLAYNEVVSGSGGRSRRTDWDERIGRDDTGVTTGMEL